MAARRSGSCRAKLRSSAAGRSRQMARAGMVSLPAHPGMRRLPMPPANQFFGALVSHPHALALLGRIVLPAGRADALARADLRRAALPPGAVVLGPVGGVDVD